MSKSESWGKRVAKNSSNSPEVFIYFDTYMVPSLWLKPVKIGTLCHLPNVQASIGLLEMISLSMTGCHAHRSEGLDFMNTALEASMILAEDASFRHHMT